MTHLGELIRRRRESFGASIEEVARWADISPDSLREAESSERLGSTLFERAGMREDMVLREDGYRPGETAREALGVPRGRSGIWSGFSMNWAFKLPGFLSSSGNWRPQASGRMGPFR